jgi:hypothetical protein
MTGRNLTLDVHARKHPTYGPASAALPCLLRTQEGRSCVIARNACFFSRLLDTPNLYFLDSMR